MQMGTYYGKPIIWRCVDIDENGPLMLSDKILSAKAMDGTGNDKSGSHGRYWYREYVGSNYWPDSNMRSWLNSDADAGEVEWLCGNPPDKNHVDRGYNAYDQEAGFLTNFTQEELGAINEVTQKFTLSNYDASLSTMGTDRHEIRNDITEVVSNYDTARGIEVTDKIFPIDVKQLYAVYENREILGDDYYIGEPTAECVENNAFKSDEIAVGKKWRYCLRTPTESSCDFRCVDPDGKITYVATANNGYNSGIRPAFYLNQGAVIKSGAGTADYPYSLQEDAIQIGEYMQMGTYYGKPIIWRCVDIDEHGPLMLSDKILSAKAMDGKGNDKSGSHSRGWLRDIFGSNYWPDSNMRLWLNSDDAAGEIEWLCGNPPDKDHVDRGYNAYDQEAGFLNGFAQEEIDAIKKLRKNSRLHIPMLIWQHRSLGKDTNTIRI